AGTCDIPARRHSSEEKAADMRRAVHEPNRAPTRYVVLPKNIGFPVAIEIATTNNAETRGDDAKVYRAEKRGSIHQPDHTLAGRFILQNNIWLTVAIEIRSSRDLPANWYRREAHATDDA